MIRQLGYLIALCLASECFAAAPTATVNDFIGTWRITAVAGVTRVTTSDADRRALLGKYLLVKRQGMELAGESFCSHVPGDLHVARIEAKEEISPADGLSPAQLGLPEKIDSLDMGCVDLLFADGRLVFFADGAYYRAERMSDRL